MIIVRRGGHGMCYDFFLRHGPDLYRPGGADAKSTHRHKECLFYLPLASAWPFATWPAQSRARCTPPIYVALMKVAPDKAERLRARGSRRRQRAGEKRPGSHELTEKMISIRGEMTPKEQAALQKAELKSIDWRTLWGIPAIFSGAVVLRFLSLPSCITLF